jgi:hypothetical protein
LRDVHELIELVTAQVIFQNAGYAPNLIARRTRTNHRECSIGSRFSRYRDGEKPEIFLVVEDTKIRRKMP